VGLVTQSAWCVLGRVPYPFEVPAPSFEWIVGDTYKALVSGRVALYGLCVTCPESLVSSQLLRTVC
jgi:hypothetical protein